MLRFTRVRSALVMTGVASLLLATSVTAGAASTTGVYNAAAAKMVPASLKGKVLQVATDATYPPDEMMSGSTMIGFDVDLMKAIGTTLGLKINETNVTFDSIIAGIQAGKYQVGNSSFTDTKARQASVNFVDYFQAGEGVYAKSSSNAKFIGLMSFCGLTVAVETGTTEQSDAVATAKKCPASKKLTVLPYPTQTSANLAVSSGRAAVGFVDSQVAGYIVSQAKGAFKLVGKAIKVAPYGIATSKSAAGKGLALAIQKALQVMMSIGKYNAILAKWGVTAGALPANKIILNGATS